MPPESSRGKRPPKPSRPTRLSSSSIQTRSGLVPLISKGKLMLASRLRQGRRLASWNTMPISGFGPVTGMPSSSTSPAVRPCSPDIDQSSVVLPQPDGPTIETISPSMMSSEQRSMASRSPDRVLYTLVAPFTRSLGCVECPAVIVPRAALPTVERPRLGQAPLYAVCNYPTFRVKRTVIRLSPFSRTAHVSGHFGACIVRKFPTS